MFPAYIEEEKPKIVVSPDFFSRPLFRQIIFKTALVLLEKLLLQRVAF